MKKFLLRYGFYIVRWQLSTPVLALCVWWLGDTSPITATIIANFIGALKFFWIDRLIFRVKTAKLPLWEIMDNEQCCDCGKIGQCYRIVEWYNYDKRGDIRPEYRCNDCRIAKLHNIETKMRKQKQNKS
jgi:hypothetical protein